MGQIRKASLNIRVWNTMENCEEIIKKVLGEICLV